LLRHARRPFAKTLRIYKRSRGLCEHLAQHQRNNRPSPQSTHTPVPHPQTLSSRRENSGKRSASEFGVEGPCAPSVREETFTEKFVEGAHRPLNFSGNHFPAPTTPRPQ